MIYNAQMIEENRIVELETKVAYQEDLIQELNKTVFEQQKQLQQLEAAYKFLHAQSKELAAATAAGKPVDEKPPHY